MKIPLDLAVRAKIVARRGSRATARLLRLQLETVASSETEAIRASASVRLGNMTSQKAALRTARWPCALSARGAHSQVARSAGDPFKEFTLIVDKDQSSIPPPSHSWCN
jgi:hypothetical protein